jgi:acetolactate synthase-1/2/3 large subunit
VPVPRIGGSKSIGAFRARLPSCADEFKPLAGLVSGASCGRARLVFPAALGMKLGTPDRTVVATMGDGSYMFSNPVVCHQIAEALDLPILVIVLNNAEWGAVRQSVLDHYPEGYAARSNRMPLTQLSPVPDFTHVAKASRAYAARVEQAVDLESALRDGLKQIEQNKTLAFLDVVVTR